ncbi:hypothetical protein F0562_005930 [Nyssa sinensis]|uniref:Uncharacterized protein n=1 Tax=Nyssa sinensis TaxID=561372 RepID=A0A5J5AN97_9ASTE|nr:hypothetical protein F0562_005930 [Nyssa sinensis]
MRSEWVVSVAKMVESMVVVGGHEWWSHWCANWEAKRELMAVRVFEREEPKGRNCELLALGNESSLNYKEREGLPETVDGAHVGDSGGGTVMVWNDVKLLLEQTATTLKRAPSSHLPSQAAAIAVPARSCCLVSESSAISEILSQAERS